MLWWFMPSIKISKLTPPKWSNSRNILSAAFSAALRHHLSFKDIRGNLNTLTVKLDAGEYDTIILAAAGLQRLGMSSHPSSPCQLTFPTHAVGQGALGIRIPLMIRNAVTQAIEHVPTRDRA